MTAKEKNKLAGIFLLAHGSLLGLMYLAMIGFMSVFFEDAPGGFVIVMTVFVAILASFFVAPQIIGGWKMYKERPNARNWGIAAAIMACMNMPLGTVVGVFTLIFLFNDESKHFYESRTSRNYLGEANTLDDFRYNENREKQPYDWR